MIKQLKLIGTKLIGTPITTQEELDDSLDRAYKKKVDKLEYSLVKPLRKENHEQWINIVCSEIIKNNIKKDSILNGFHTLIQGKFSFYTYQIYIPNNNITDELINYIVFFRTSNKGLKTLRLNCCHTNDTDSVEMLDMLYDEVLSRIYLEDGHNRRYLTFTERRSLRKTFPHLTEMYKNTLMDMF